MFTIYQITNKINGKSYIGFTTLPSGKRWKRHIYLTNRGSKIYFHNAIRKYGPENFTCEILEDGWSPEIGLKIREPYWISVLKPEYNLTAGGEGQLGRYMSEETKHKISLSNKGKTLSEETRVKISLGMKGKKNCLGNTLSSEHRAKLSLVSRGRIFSKESKHKMSLAMEGNQNALGHQHSQETKAKLSLAAKIGE